MKYCVIKDTTKIIDGSDNPDEIMAENALNSGYSAEQVEILTHDEYLMRKANEPIPPPPINEIEILKEENERLKIRLRTTEQIASETSTTQQELIELLIDMGVI